MHYKEIHIGKLIERRADELGMNKAEIARRINTTRQNMDNILSKKSIDTFRLSQISNVLNYDFFQYYSNAVSKEKVDTMEVNEPSNIYLHKSNGPKISINIEVDDPEMKEAILKMIKEK